MTGARRSGARLLGAIFGLLSLSFPFLVLFVADQVGSWPLVAALVAVIVLRWLVSPGADQLHRALMAQTLAVGVIAATSLFDDDLAALLYPVAINLALLAVFAASLRTPPSMIERFARLTEPDLPPQAIAYCRSVTRVWCGFFIVNGLIALGTVIVADRTVWAVYNGLIAYLAAGSLFGVEFLVRRRVRRRFEEAPH